MKRTISDATGGPAHPQHTQSSEAVEHQFSFSSCGEKGEHKILVAYASQFGTTHEVAEVIGQVLCKGGVAVEIKWIKNVKDLQNYDAVIIGSAIQYDQWMPEARKYVTANQQILSTLPVAYFFTCLTLAIQNEKTERQAKVYSDKLYSLHPQIIPVSVGRFAGAVYYSKLSFFLRLMFRGLSLITGVQEGDYRDWDAIRDWAKDVHSKLILNPANDPEVFVK